jgi:hypothetical protein
MTGYAANQDRELQAEMVAAALTWSEPNRDVEVPRKRADEMSGGPFSCVWSGKRPTALNLDIDHLLPWAAWLCSDLWNIAPTHRDVNQRQKRDRLPTREARQRVRDAISGSWRTAYLRADDMLLPVRFGAEARTA